MSEPADSSALARVPDLPQWVDTRGMLLTARARISPATPSLTRHGFVVELASRSLLSVVGQPPVELIAERAHGMAGHANVLCPLEQAPHVQQALTGWVRHHARIHALPGVADWEAQPEREVSAFALGDAPSLEHLPEHLREELQAALEGHPSARFVSGALPERQPADASTVAIPVAAAWLDGRPVAFCYPALQTETLWDVSVETMPEYRGRGLAGRAARAMIRYMRARGKAPVWGALESNAGSLSVARQLGFVAVGDLAVFTPH